VQPPLGRRLFYRLLALTGASREDEQGLPARALRWSVIQAVRALSRLKSLEFPTRGTGGWWWLWRWKFEFLMNWFEWESVVWARSFIRPGMTVLDLGAHVGYYTRLFSEWVGPKGKVYAFEASPENQAILQRNVSSARYANVEVVPRAISDRAGIAKLFVSPGHSNHSLLPGFTAAETVVEIPAVSVDVFLAERGIPSLDFVKMDIEGAETMALDGMRQTIHASPRIALLVECNLLSIQTRGSTPTEFLSMIEGLGLRPSAILKDATLGPLPAEADIDLYVNLLCVKPEDRRAAGSTAVPRPSAA
jgi:FkbM family methyltransferase